MIVTKPRCRFRTKRWSSATTNNGSTSSSKAQRCAKNDHDHGFVILVRQMIMMVIFMIILVTEVSNGGQMPLLSDNAREGPNWQLHEGNCHQNRVHDHQGWICFCYFCYFAIKLYLSRYDIVVHGSWFMTTKVGFVLAIFATLLFCYKTLPFPVWHRGSWFMTTKVGFVSLKITSGCQNDQRKCPILEMTNFNHANFDDDLLGGTCTSHLVPPAPRFRLLLRLPQKRQVIYIPTPWLSCSNVDPISWLFHALLILIVEMIIAILLLI